MPDPPRPSALLAGVTAWTNSMGMKFVRIAPGRFAMGTPEREPDRMQNEKRHEVRITRAYFLGVHEVTRGQFRAFVNDTGYRTDAEKAGFAIIFTGTEQQRRRGGSWRDVGYEQTDDHPVVSMSWNDAVAFAAWLSGRPFFAVEAARQNARGGGFADAADAGEEEGMRDPSALQGLAERARDVLLADQFGEALGAPFARQHQMR